MGSDTWVQLAVEQPDLQQVESLQQVLLLQMQQGLLQILHILIMFVQIVVAVHLVNGQQGLLLTPCVML